MSNFDSTKKTPKTKAATAKPSTENNAKKRWSFIQSNLSSAATEWAEAEQKAPVKTPEEVQLEKVKNIIENLKDKLNEF